MEKLTCPNCGWASKVSFLKRKQVFYCSHCDTEWEKPKEEEK